MCINIRFNSSVNFFMVLDSCKYSCFIYSLLFINLMAFKQLNGLLLVLYIHKYINACL